MSSWDGDRAKPQGPSWADVVIATLLGIILGWFLHVIM